jgi:ABC-type branched-subunit amino acid transport system ATPase component
MSSSDPLLVLQDVHAAYFQREVLRGLSLSVRKGEVLVLAGANGSGKSTTLKVVAGLLALTNGRVLYKDQDLRHLEATDRQRLGVGYLMQGGRVFPNLTVRENLELATAHGQPESGGAWVLGSCFPTLGQHGEQRAGLLSGGQRQMLAIEMVLSQNPALLLLDEPFAALSEDASSELQACLNAYVARDDRAALLVEQELPATRAWKHQATLSNGVVTSISEDTV